MADNEIIIEIKGKLDTIEKQLDDLENKVQKKGTAIGAGLVAGITAAVAEQGLKFLGAATKTIVGGFEKAVEEASQAQKAVTLFNSSLAAAGNFSRQASEDFLGFAKALQQTSGIADEVILKNSSILASLGGLSGQGLERATEAAVNFAATGRVSLESAFDAVAKAAAGNTAALSRYGIRVDESIPQSERFAAALAKLEDKFKGLAAAQINTFSGAVQLLSVNFNDIFESLGNFVTQSPVVIAVLKELGKIFGEVSRSIDKFKVGDLFGSLIRQALSFGQTFITFVIAPLEQGFNIVKAFASATQTGFLLIADAVAQATQGIAFLFDKVFKTGIGEAVTQFQEQIQGKLLQSASETGDSLKEIFDFKFSNSVSNFVGRLQEAAANAGPLMDAVKNSVSGAADATSASIEAAAKKINQSIQQGILNTISVGAQAIGASLVKGAKAFDGFKNAVLNIIGDMAIQIGTTLVGIGIGIENLKAGLLTLSGAGAIAAGLALIAIGGLLKSLSSGDTGGLGVGGGVGTPAAGPSVGGGTFGPTEELASQAGTSVVVNIQGNVLDRRETGLEIAAVMQEHFNNNGNIGVVGAS